MNWLFRRMSTLPGRILRRLVAQECVNLGHDLGSQLGQELQTLTVVDDLLRPGSTSDDRRHILVLETPCQGQLGEFETELIGESLPSSQLPPPVIGLHAHLQLNDLGNIIRDPRISPILSNPTNEPILALGKSRTSRRLSHGIIVFPT